MERAKQIWAVIQHVQVGDEDFLFFFYDEQKARDCAAGLNLKTKTQNFEARLLPMEDA